jgi:hypothetical protein
VGGRPLVIDEPLHGLEIRPSITRELLRFPLLLATLQALCAAVLAGWAAMVRFGRPRAAPRPLSPGTAFLVESTAGLLQHGGHTGHALAAYWKDAREEVLRRLHGRGAPAADPDAALRRLLDARGKGDTLEALEARVQALRGRKLGVQATEAEAVRTALEIHRWREELTHGA